MFLEKRSDDIALDADTATMDDAHFRKSRLDALLQILFYDARYVFGLKSVKIDGIFERNRHGFAEWRVLLAIRRIKPFVFVPLAHKKKGARTTSLPPSVVNSPSSCWS